MKNVVYRLIKECTKTNGTGKKSYGVEVIKDGVRAEYIGGAFEKKRKGRKFIRLCRKHDVSPVHVADVLEDMLK